MTFISPTAATEAAQQELDERRALLAAVEERFRDSDPTVTIEELRAHEDLVRTGVLLVDAAARTLERSSAAQRRETYELVAAEARAHITIGAAGVGELLQEYVDLGRRLYARAQEYRDRGAAIHQRARVALGDAVEHNELAALADAGLRDWAPGSWMNGSFRLTDDDGTDRNVILPPSPTDVVAAGTAVALEGIPGARANSGDAAGYMPLIDAAHRTFNALPEIEPTDWQVTY